MSHPGGDDDLLVRARSVLLDALVALEAHRDSVVVIGAQAIYLHTGEAPVAVAAFTKDSDLGMDPRTLGEHPLIEEAMTRAGFAHDAAVDQPGSWLSPEGIPVDLMVPDAVAGRGRRSVDAPPHSKHALRRAIGLEAAIADNAMMSVRPLAADDTRMVEARVASPAALLVAKLHKLGERLRTPSRLVDKDAYDVYRLLLAVPTGALVVHLTRLLSDDLAGGVTRAALDYLVELFQDSSSAGALMAGRAEDLVGDPAVVAASCAALAGDLLDALFD